MAVTNQVHTILYIYEPMKTTRFPISVGYQLKVSLLTRAYDFKLFRNFDIIMSC